MRASPTTFKDAVYPDKPCHGPRAGQSDVDKKGSRLGYTLGVLRCPFVNSWQSPGGGHACILFQTFPHRRAVEVCEVHHPARRPGGPQEAPKAHVPNGTVRIHRKTGSLGFFLQIFISFLPRARPELKVEVRYYRVSVSSRH